MLVSIPIDLIKLSDVVKNQVAEKTEYKHLVTKVGNIDITNFVKKKQKQKLLK